MTRPPPRPRRTIRLRDLPQKAARPAPPKPPDPEPIKVGELVEVGVDEFGYTCGPARTAAIARWVTLGTVTKLGSSGDVFVDGPGLAEVLPAATAKTPWASVSLRRVT